METYERNCGEVLKDFKESLEKIDFMEAYNPDSAVFGTALRLGLMWHLLKELEDCSTEKVAESKSDETGDEIADEISGAKKYLQRYIDSGDEVFREMSKDEIRHAEILLRKASAKLPGVEEKKRLKEREAEIKEVAEQIGEA